MSPFAARRQWREPFVPSEDAEELYEQAPCGYFSMLADDTISRVNQTLLDWTGYERGQLVGATRLTDLLTGGGRLYFETHIRPSLASNGSIHEVDLDIRCADGREMPVLLNATVVRAPDGTIATTRVSVFDVTRRREYEDELRRARSEAEASERRARELAQTLQAALLPPFAPRIPGLEVGVVYLPAGDGFQLGGDFYDVFASSEDEWVLAVGDVCGKGVAAAAVTGLARYSIQAASIRRRQPRKVLADLNEVLQRSRTERFCTAVCARLRSTPEGGGADLTFSLAGHLPPVLVTEDGAAQVGATGTLLGVCPDVELHDTQIRLDPGDSLVMYTDGLTEARRHGEFLGEDGLLALVAANAHLDAQDMATTLADAAVEFQDGVTRDDIVVLVIRVPTVQAPMREGVHPTA